MALFYAGTQYPSGRLSDHLSRKTILVVSVVLALLGVIVLAGTPTYAFFLVGTAIIGADDGLYGTASRALLSDLFIDRRGQAFGIHMAFIDVGGVLGAGVASAVLIVAVWRSVFLLAVVLLVPTAFFFHVWSRESYVIAPVSLAIRETGVRLFGNARLRLLLVAYALSYSPGAASRGSSRRSSRLTTGSHLRSRVRRSPGCSSSASSPNRSPAGSAIERPAR